MVELLVAMLVEVMDKLILFNQLEFFNECLLIYGVVVTNELVDLAKKKIRIVLIFRCILKIPMTLSVGVFCIICILGLFFLINGPLGYVLVYFLGI